MKLVFDRHCPQTSPSSFSFLASCSAAPTKARNAIEAESIRLAAVGLTIAWVADQSAKPHIIGCRVIENTPLGSPMLVTGFPGDGKAGLRRSEPTNSTEPSHINRVAKLNPHCPASHSGCGASADAGLYALIIQAKVSSETSE